MPEKTIAELLGQTPVTGGTVKDLLDQSSKMEEPKPTTVGDLLTQQQVTPLGQTLTLPQAMAEPTKDDKLLSWFKDRQPTSQVISEDDRLLGKKGMTLNEIKRYKQEVESYNEEDQPLGGLLGKFTGTGSSLAGDFAAFGFGATAASRLASTLGMTPVGKVALTAASVGLLYAQKQAVERFFKGADKELGLLGGKPDSEKGSFERGAEDILEGGAFVAGPASLGKGFKMFKESYPAIKAGVIESSLGQAIKKPAEWINEYISDPVWEGLKTAANKKILPTAEKMWAHGHQESTRVWKSISEVMQPAIERMDAKKQGLFRNPKVLKEHLTNWGNKIGNELANESDPLVRYEVSKGLRGTPISELTTERAKEIISKYDSSLSDLNMKPRHENAFREEIGKVIGKRLESPEEIFMGEEFKSYLDPIIARVGEGKINNLLRQIIPSEIGVGKFSFKVRSKSKVEELQKGLEDLIGDSSVPYSVQTAAKDLYNLPATLPEEVARSAKSLTEKILTENLKREAGVVLTDKPEKVISDLKGILKEGNLSPEDISTIEKRIELIKKSEYLPSTWHSFVQGGRSLYVQRDVELELKAIQKIPEIANKMFNKYFMGPWKVAKVMLRPAAWARNGMTNAVQNHLGGLPLWDVGTYLQAYQGMRGSLQSKVEGAAVGKHWKDWNKITGGTGTFTQNDVIQLGQGMKYGDNMLDKSLALFDKFSAPGKAVYQAEEQFFKFAKYLDNIKKGMGKKEAAWDAMKWTFDYSEVTRATAWTRSYLAPFFTWQSKVFPQVLEAIVKNPVKATGMFMMYQQLQNAAVSSVGMSEGEFNSFKEKMPSYLSNGLMFPLPWRDEQGRLNFLDLTYIIPGIGDAYQMSGHPMAQIFQHPLLSIGAGIQANKKFSGAPIYYDWEPFPTRAAKVLGYVWEQLVPAPFPGGTDWNNLYQAYVQTPMSEFNPNMRDLSRVQASASALGLKTIPVNESSVYQGYQGQVKAKMREINAQFKKELKNARSQEERQGIIERYSSYLREARLPSSASQE